jgi:hypothetical protein
VLYEAPIGTPSGRNLLLFGFGIQTRLTAFVT